jgi:hypothetical protein
VISSSSLFPRPRKSGRATDPLFVRSYRTVHGELACCGPSPLTRRNGRHRSAMGIDVRRRFRVVERVRKQGQLHTSRGLGLQRVERGLTTASSIASRSLCGMSSRMVLSFHLAVCACRPSRNCVPSARPRACQGREPRRGWSEAESLDRIATSRTFAVVMAGVVPFVSFRSGIGGRTRAGACGPCET